MFADYRVVYVYVLAFSSQQQYVLYIRLHTVYLINTSLLNADIRRSRKASSPCSQLRTFSSCCRWCICVIGSDMITVHIDGFWGTILISVSLSLLFNAAMSSFNA